MPLPIQAQPPRGIRCSSTLDTVTLQLPADFGALLRLLKRFFLLLVVISVVLGFTGNFVMIGGVIFVLSPVLTYRVIHLPRTTLEVQAANLTVRCMGREPITVPLEDLQQVAVVENIPQLCTRGGEVRLNTSLLAAQLTWLQGYLVALADHRRVLLQSQGHDLDTEPIPASLQNLQGITG